MSGPKHVMFLIWANQVFSLWKQGVQCSETKPKLPFSKFICWWQVTPNRTSHSQVERFLSRNPHRQCVTEIFHGDYPSRSRWKCEKDVHMFYYLLYVSLRYTQCSIEGILLDLRLEVNRFSSHTYLCSDSIRWLYSGFYADKRV